MLLENVIISYIKKLSKNFIYFLFMFLSSCAFCADNSVELFEYKNFTFDKNKIYRYSESKIYIVKGKSVYEKSSDYIEKLFSVNTLYYIKGIVVNKKYFVFYGSNDITVIDRENGELLWSKKFEDKVMLRPLIYLDSLYVSFDYDKIACIDLFSGDFNWQYKNNVTNLHPYVYIKLIQSDTYLFYITSNKMHIINKFTGAFIDRVSIKPRHINLNLLKEARINHIELYNKILYICYDNGILLAFDTEYRFFVWQKTFFNFSSFTIYEKYILALRKNGMISLINKSDGSIVLNYSFLLGKKLKKIIFFEELEKIVIIGDKSIYLLDFSRNKIKQCKNINIKIDDIFKSSYNSFLLISKNKKLKELFF